MACGQATTRPQTYPERAPGSRSASEKVNEFGPDGARSRKNVNYPRAPVVVVAVSSDPILPHR